LRVREARRERALRRIAEGALATVLGGLILWFFTTSLSQSSSPPRIEKTSLAVKGDVPLEPRFSAISQEPFGKEAANSIGGLAAETPKTTERSTASREQPDRRIDAPPLLSITIPKTIPSPEKNATPPFSISFPTSSVPGPRPKSLFTYNIPPNPYLLFECFSRYREGEASNWGPDTVVILGLDHRHWLVSNVEGTHPVGRKMQLPLRFLWECRYSANMPEVTRGLLGWWKDPVATKISFLNEQGGRDAIEWVVRCGNDPTRLNPLGSSSLYAKRYFHTIRLPDGTAGEIGTIQPDGILRIERDKIVVKVFLDGQSVAVGNMNFPGELSGFEIDVVKARNGAIFFTDFKVQK
jgi:hypothetical protein